MGGDDPLLGSLADRVREVLLVLLELDEFLELALVLDPGPTLLLVAALIMPGLPGRKLAPEAAGLLNSTSREARAIFSM